MVNHRSARHPHPTLSQSERVLIHALIKTLRCVGLPNGRIQQLINSHELVAKTDQLVAQLAQ
jgi:hypothetical protein